MKTSLGKVRKRQTSQTKRRKLRGTVMKMIAIMESNPEMIKDPVTEFLVTGRTGRRNAMADILGPNASVTSSDLPKRLESLTTMDGEQESSSMTHSKDFEQQETMPESKKTAETSDTLDKAKAEAKS